MKNKKLLTLLLAGVLLFCAACKKEDNKVNSDNVSVENSIDDYTSDLWVENYDGYNFRILIRPGQTPDQYVEEDSADPIESAVYKRNKTVEEMFNIKISATESSNSNAETDALSSILAGDDAYDIIFGHQGAVFQYTTKGAVHNIYDIDTIHTDKPWWSKDMVEGCTIGGNLYVLDGDISLHRLKNAMCLYFNKDLFDELGLEYPYELVEYGEWTFDEFEKIAKQGAKDLDGDGVMDRRYDRFGLVATEWGMSIGILYTGGQRIYTKNEEGLLELTLNTSKTVDIFDSYFELMDSDSTYLYFNGDDTNGNIFTSGRALMVDGYLSSAAGFRTMENNFGILPFPKYEYEDNYATMVNAYGHIFAIPVTVEDKERTGAIIEALAAIGSRDVIPVFYDQSLKTKFTRDNESEGMIDIIKESIIYDIGYSTGGPLGYIGNNLAHSTTHDFASQYASKEGSALRSLADFNSAYAGVTEE